MPETTSIPRASRQLPAAAAPPVRLVLVEEEGGRRRANASESSLETVALVGSADAGAASRRAVQRITALERQRRTIAQAEILVAASPDTDTRSARFRARALISRALLRHMTQAGGGELVLVADERAGSRLRTELLALADALLAQLRGGAVTVSVRFT